MQVTLTPLEFFHAANAGFFRQVSNLTRGLRDAYGLRGDGWGEHITGSVGEFVLAKGLNVFWAGPGTFRGGDVGAIQVRTTPRGDGSLIAHREDRDDAAYVLVTGSFPTFVIRGWLYGREAKDQRYWWNRGDRSAYFVPQGSLRDAATIPIER